MRSIETNFAFPLASVKPLEDLSTYRHYCVDATVKALNTGPRTRATCPACRASSSELGLISGLTYDHCPGCGSIFLRDVAEDDTWYDLLEEIGQKRHSSFEASLEQSRIENVYVPKRDWIESTLRLHGITEASVLEATSGPSPLTALLRNGTFKSVSSIPERTLVDQAGMSKLEGPNSLHAWDAAVLLESLDRSSNPQAMLRGLAQQLRIGGLVFITAVAACGFDIIALGLNNLYLHPPDRTNCFSVNGLNHLLERAGYTLVEISTPGVLDVEIVNAHRRYRTDLSLSPFEIQILDSDLDTREAFQSFLQQNRMSSFARIVARRTA